MVPLAPEFRYPFMVEVAETAPVLTPCGVACSPPSSGALPADDNSGQR
jgi:hypothetical protein